MIAVVLSLPGAIFQYDTHKVHYHTVEVRWRFSFPGSSRRKIYNAELDITLDFNTKISLWDEIDITLACTSRFRQTNSALCTCKITYNSGKTKYNVVKSG